jgi:predicted ArsR family transcriptional regulator
MPVPTQPEPISALDRVTTLASPVRRRLYRHVAAAGKAVGRDEAAAALGIGRSLAAFHLDRLVRDGLLVTEFRRLTGKTGPGAGRTAKLYRRSDRELEVAIPDRRYAELAELLATAGETSPSTSDAVRASLWEQGWERGALLGRTAAQVASIDAPASKVLAATAAVLGQAGYEPIIDGTDAVRLRNCPFDAVARRHRDLVCGTLNRALVAGLAETLGRGALTASLEPSEGMCCMVVRWTADGGPQ